MEIKAERFNISMTHEELWATAFDVKGALISTLKSHWINHQRDWQTHEKQRLFRLKTMFNHLGQPEFYNDLLEEANNIFVEFNNKRK